MLKIIIILFMWCSVSEASEYFIVTYNVWFDYSTSEERVPKLLDAIEKPDVIAFQEVKRWFVNDLKRDGRFRNYNIVMKNGWNDSIRGGLVILTKSKILEQAYYDLPSTMGRGMLYAVINIDGTSVCIATSHLESRLEDTNLRIKQLKIIFEKTSSCNNLILLGDLNFGDGEPENEVIDSTYLDVWKTLKGDKLGYTWDIKKNKLAEENSFPSEGSRRLDKIYVKGKHLMPVEIQIIGDIPFQSPAGKVLFPSDHFGLSAKFAIH